jgi:bacterioferritin (cytochrome b1)
MERFVRRQNIKRYRTLLRETKDEATRRLIQKLLTEEEEKQFAPRTRLRTAGALHAR